MPPEEQTNPLGRKFVQTETPDTLWDGKFTDFFDELDVVRNSYELYTKRRLSDRVQTGRSIKLRGRDFAQTGTNKNTFLLSGAIRGDGAAVTISNTITETFLGTFVVHANELEIGNTFRIRAGGVYGFDAPTTTLTIRLGLSTVSPYNAVSTAWHTLTPTNAVAANLFWKMEWFGILSAVGSSGTMESQATTRFNATNIDSANTSAVTFSTIQENHITLSAQFSAANLGDTITCRYFIVEVIN